MKRMNFFTPLGILVLAISVMSFSGCIVDTCTTCVDPPPCSYGPDGVPGPAFFGLDWTANQPDYVWTNNSAIPAVFRYGTHYNSFPGNFDLYYEGASYVGCCLVEYYWDVNFTVWVNTGTAGGCGYAGVDGLPSYLMLIMGPDGPGEVRTNKMAEAGFTTEVVSRTDDEIIIQQVKGDINIRVKYTRLEKSRKDELSKEGVRTAEAS